MKKAPTLAEASPYRSVAQELEAMRGMLRLASRQYMERIEREILRVQEQVVTAGMLAAEREKMLAVKSGEKVPRGKGRNQQQLEQEMSRVRDLRDMLTLVRTMQIKPEEGRRKDLKKLEAVISDLKQMTAGWG